MEKLTFINAMGRSIEMYAAPFQVSKIDGLGDVKADTQTQKSPSQDGSTYIDTLLQERPITVELTIRGKSEVETQQRRQEFASVFNPKLGEGLLKYESDIVVREIKAVVDGVPTFPSGNSNRGPNFQKALLNLICPNPYWQSTEVEEDPVFQPLFSFPFDGVFEMGIQRDERIIYNDGDAPTPVQIEFYGPATNPIITNVTTGEFIKVNRTLVEGEHLKVDTTRGQKSVILVNEDGTETNVFNWIDLDSTFFQLDIGENVISYSADSDIQGATVNIEYRKLYNAV